MDKTFKIVVTVSLVIIAGLQVVNWIDSKRATNKDKTGSDALFVDQSRVRICEARFNTGWWVARPEERQAKVVDCIEGR
jgi:hypothetical protein